MMMRRRNRSWRRGKTIVWLLRIWNVNIILTNVLNINMAILFVFGLSNNIEVN